MQIYRPKMTLTYKSLDATKTEHSSLKLVDNQLIDQSPNSTSLHSPLLSATPILDSTDKMEVLANTSIKSTLWSLPLCLPSTQPSTLCNISPADNEDDETREQHSPARAEETDKTSKVIKSLSHQSNPPLRDISNKLRSEIRELHVMLMDATIKNLSGISTDRRGGTGGVTAPLLLLYPQYVSSSSCWRWTYCLIQWPLPTQKQALGLPFL